MTPPRHPGPLPAPDLFSYAPPTPAPPREEPSATLFPDAAPPGQVPCSGACVWVEFGLATVEGGCEMCRVFDLTPGVVNDGLTFLFGLRQADRRLGKPVPFLTCALFKRGAIHRQVLSLGFEAAGFA